MLPRFEHVSMITPIYICLFPFHLCDEQQIEEHSRLANLAFLQANLGVSRVLYNLNSAKNSRMKGKKIINLSFFLNKARQQFLMYSKATFWFAGMLSLAEEIEGSDINDDSTVDEKIEIIKIVTHCVSSIAAFYEQEIPNSVFKMLNFANSLFDLVAHCPDYSLALAKVNYLNVVSIYAIKTRQYNFGLQVFNDLFTVYTSRAIDCNNEYFLAALSNYLCFLRKCTKKLASRMLEVETILSQLFVKFLTKVMLEQSTAEVIASRMTLLSAVLRQNAGLLSRHQKEVNALIIHFYQSTKKKLPDNMVQFIYKQKVAAMVSFKVTYNPDELKFYSGSTNPRRMVKRVEEEVEPQLKLSKIEAMLQQSLEMLTEQKIVSARYSTLQRQTITESMKPIQSPVASKFILPQPSPESKSLQTLQPLPRSLTRKRQALVPSKLNKTAVTTVARFKAMTFKIHSIFIDVNEDGMLVSDYTKQNKRYVEWNTVSLIMQRIELHFPFEEFLKVPMQNYYDFVRIIAFYLVKSDSRQILLSPRPLPLLQVNQLIRLFKQEGKYLKLALMNPYDTDKFVGVIDCYLSEHDQFFKCLHENEFLNYLNQRVSRSSGDPSKEENIYHVDFLKRKRDTTVTELSNQLHTESLERPVQEKGCLYKCLFLLKNNLQLYVKITDNIQASTFEDFCIQVKIQNLETNTQPYNLQPNNNNKKISKVVEIPISKLLHFFPSQALSLKEYIPLYSRMIIDMLNQFQSYAEEINLGGLSFQIQLHASRTEIVEYGKYYTVVSAELVGSRQRVWALIIRWYDLAFVNEKVTIMMNPYHDFLQGIIKASSEQQTQILKNLLLNESVKETFNWLKKANKLESRMNLFQYLHANNLI